MSILRTILDCYRKYYAAGGVNVLLLIALLWLYQRRSGKKIMAVVQAALVMIGIIVFPVTAKLIMLMIGEDVYWRVFWLLPVMVILAYAGTEFVWERRGRAGKVITALCCAGVIAVNGTFVFGGNFFTPRENNYKIPTPVILVTDAINAHYAEGNVSRRKVACPTSIAVYIRLYDGSIRQRYGRYTMSHPHAQHGIYEEINSDHPDYARLAKMCRKKKCDYVVLTLESDNRAVMEAQGYECIFSDAGYAVYFDTGFYETE